MFFSEDCWADIGWFLYKTMIIKTFMELLVSENSLIFAKCWQPQNSSGDHVSLHLFVYPVQRGRWTHTSPKFEFWKYYSFALFWNENLCCCFCRILARRMKDEFSGLMVTIQWIAVLEQNQWQRCTDMEKHHALSLVVCLLGTRTYELFIRFLDWS